MPINFTINNLMLTKKYYSESLKERDENFFDPNQFKIFGKEKKSKWTEENTERQPTEVKKIKRDAKANVV